MRVPALAAVAAGSILLTGCTVKPPTQAEIQAKLTNDSTLSFVKNSVDATKYTNFVNCVATRFRNNGNAKDLKDYVKGKKQLEDVRGKSKTSTTRRAGSTSSRKITSNANVDSIIDDCITITGAVAATPTALPS